MHKTFLTTALVTLGSLLCTSTVLGDHSIIRRNYEVRRIDLEQDYKARRSANKYAFHRERDALEAARRRANRIDCRDTRAIRVRAINRDLSALSRDYHAKNRAITAWYNSERNDLRKAYEIALRDARRRPIIVDTAPIRREVVIERPIYTRPTPRPIVVERAEYELPAPIVRPHAHPANCDCHICEPPPVDTCPTRGSFDPGYGYRDVGYGRDFAPASFGRKPNALDWTNLIFSLIR